MAELSMRMDPTTYWFGENFLSRSSYHRDTPKVFNKPDHSLDTEATYSWRPRIHIVLHFVRIQGIAAPPRF